MQDIFDYDVCDQNGEEIGTIENIWLDATDDIEFIGIKTDWLGIGRNHLIPAEGIIVDDDERMIRLPYDETFIRNSPDFEPSEELDEDDETGARAYFGVPEPELEYEIEFERSRFYD